MSRRIKELFGLIAASSCCVAFTGAGVSVLSGIPDFRGGFCGGPAGGETATTARRNSGGESGGGGTDGVSGGETGQGRINAETIFDSAYFEKDPSLFYSFAASRIYAGKKPSLVHRVLAALEEQGLVQAVITQNIDMLHQKAGCRRVIELHGSPHIHYCLFCPGIRVGYEEVSAALRQGELPRCGRCGRVLKPALAFYGEPLPLEARKEAEDEARKADLMLVLGTSLSVQPAAGLPRTTLRNNGKLVIVNRDKTPLDHLAALRFSSLEAVFGGLEALLNRRNGF
jgi:NAD-dependent deacetylase